MEIKKIYTCFYTVCSTKLYCSVFNPTGKSALSAGLPIDPLLQLPEVPPPASNSLDNETIQLNVEQQEVVNAVMSSHQDIQNGAPPRSRAFFIDGPGGTGKTTIYNRLISSFQQINMKVSIKKTNVFYLDFIM